MATYTKAKLFKQMSKRMSKNDLLRLCVYLSDEAPLSDLNPDNLAYELDPSILELIDYCENHNALPVLVSTLQAEFPHVLTEATADSIAPIFTVANLAKKLAKIDELYRYSKAGMLEVPELRQREIEKLGPVDVEQVRPDIITLQQLRRDDLLTDTEYEQARRRLLGLQDEQP